MDFLKMYSVQDFPQAVSEEESDVTDHHDVAPGAELYFRTGFFYCPGFAKGNKRIRAGWL